jgi:hypothetical protein
MIPISYATCAMKYGRSAEGLGRWSSTATIFLGKLLKTRFAPPLGPNRRRSGAIPTRPSVTVADGLGAARFNTPVKLKKRRSARCPRVAALVHSSTLPKPPPRPAGGSHCLEYHLGWTGGWQGPPEGPIARDLGSASALRTKEPKTGGPPGGGAGSPRTRFVF